jgi:HlyD family secretion protein
MKKSLVAVVALVAIAGAVIGFRACRGGKATTYRFATVERGDVQQVVTATGTLDAVTTVKVGTQVSGIISELLVDFNDKVQKGQVVARLDDTLLKIAVREAQAQLVQSRSKLAQAKLDYQRALTLQKEGVVAKGDLDQAKVADDSAVADEQLAQENLAKAERNLGYATIYAPITGTVVNRFVEVGQTVAASLSAPDLFEIADLTQMQILANVDESDVSQVHTGQPVRFTVQAYGDTEFTGSVRQLRLQSQTTENVVSYVAVIAVDKAESELLPGMTATCEFVVAKAANVLLVPNAALRFRPTSEMLAALRARGRGSEGRAGEAPTTGERGAAPGTRTGRQGTTGPVPGAGGASRDGNGAATRSFPPALWYLDAKGELQRARVEVGLTDGQQTEVSGSDVHEGLQIIVGVVSGGGETASNPFQPQPSSGPRRPGGIF